MVVALDQAKIAEQQLVVAVGSEAELLQQKEILAGTVKLLQDQIAIYKNMQEMQAKFSDAKDKACDAAVKAATPTFWDNMTKYLVGGGIGAVLAVVAILLL